MNIWLLLSRFEMGGLERVQALLATGLQQEGHELSLVVGRITPAGRQLLPEGVAVRVLADAGAWSFPRGLWQALRKDCPDIIFTTASDVACLVLLLRRLAFPKMRVVCTDHLSLQDSAGSSLGKRLKRVFVHMLARHLYRLADACVAVSAGVAADVDHLVGYPCCRVIYNPVEVGGGSRTLAAARLPWSDDVPRFVWVGRMEPVKRLELLLEAYSQLAAVRPLRLVLVGGGSQEARLRESYRDVAGVFFAGHQPDPHSFIYGSRALVLCSDAEGFGNVLVEAMACGVQVIAADCPHGPAEILDGGNYGALVPRNDVAALVRAMERLLDGHGVIEPQVLMQRAALFSPERAVNAYADLIVEICR